MACPAFYIIEQVPEGFQVVALGPTKTTNLGRPAPALCLAHRWRHLWLAYLDEQLTADELRFLARFAKSPTFLADEVASTAQNLASVEAWAPSPATDRVIDACRIALRIAREAAGQPTE